MSSTRSKLNPQPSVAVVGAGIVGLITALKLQQAGHSVTVIEPCTPGGRQAASYGNGAWIHPGGIMPVSVPGLWRQVLRYMTEDTSPFVIRWRHFPRLLPWLTRFLWAGRNWAAVEKCARLRFELCRDTSIQHLAIASDACVSHLIQQRGLLTVFPDKKTYFSSIFEWNLRRQLGIQMTEFDGNALTLLEPNLSRRYRYGIRIDDGCHCTDLQAYCDGIGALLKRRGVNFIVSKATGFRFSDARVTAVVTEGGDVNCSHAVIAAGIGSARLARIAGDNVPLESERGYHVILSENGETFHHPIMPYDGKMAMTPTLQGLRVAGQVELASVASPPDWRRAEILHRFAMTVFGNHAGNRQVVDRWMGHRPSTPDGLPCIGSASFYDNLFYAFGHGHSGLTQAPATGALIVQMIAGKKHPASVSAYSAARFWQGY